MKAGDWGAQSWWCGGWRQVEKGLQTACWILFPSTANLQLCYGNQRLVCSLSKKLFRVTG